MNISIHQCFAIVKTVSIDHGVLPHTKKEINKKAKTINTAPFPPSKFSIPTLFLPLPRFPTTALTLPFMNYIHHTVYTMRPSLSKPTARSFLRSLLDAP